MADNKGIELSWLRECLIQDATKASKAKAVRMGMSNIACLAVMIVVVLVSNSSEQSLLFNLSSQQRCRCRRSCFLHCLFQSFLAIFLLNEPNGNLFFGCEATALLFTNNVVAETVSE